MAYPINDVIVVLPGTMGSTLAQHGRSVWAPSPGSLVTALRSSFQSLKTLRLPEGIGDAHPGDGVTAEALMPDVRLPLGLWTFDIGYGRLLTFLTDTFDVNTNPAVGPRNLVTFPYDWRLSNRYNGEKLRDAAEAALAEWRSQGGDCLDARLVFICHSMGGLVARWYIDHLDGSAHTRALITVGTPHRGALNAVDQLVNGVRKGVGPFKVTLTEVARSLPSLYELLPEYACIEHGDGLVKTTEIALPSVDSRMVSDAMSFHTQIDADRLACATRYELHPIGGYDQETFTTARIEGSKVICLPTIGGAEERGDATVPRLSFAPPDVKPSAAMLHYAADNHAGLVHNQAVFDQIEGILTATEVVHRGPSQRLSVEVPEILDPGEALVVRARVTNGEAPIEVVVADESASPIGPPERLLPTADGLQAAPDLPGPGVYRVTVRGAGAAGVQVSPITTVILAWPPETELGPLE
jgi:pimeloyl-ACP methyl ester carboxylesterase